MSDKPILFSASMVRALLAGTKTQTRRKLDAWTEEPVAYIEAGAITARDENDSEYRWPRTHAVGDRLYVREHWRTWDGYDAVAPRDLTPPVGLFYEADRVSEGTVVAGRFRQGMHMPRWASRLTLTVTKVRVERLQDIIEADAKAEGADGYSVDEEGVHIDGFVANYRRIWGGINGPGSWERNPWVAAYTFTVERGNIDQLASAA